jgi:hypothetical protein
MSLQRKRRPEFTGTLPDESYGEVVNQPANMISLNPDGTCRLTPITYPEVLRET